jgi:hypothetical protein
VNPYRDTLGALEDYAEAVLGEGHAGSVTPANLQDVLPFARWKGVGGPRTQLEDSPRFDLDVWAATAVAAKSSIEALLTPLLDVGPIRAAGVTLDQVLIDAGPRELPWADPNVRRWGATLQVVVRR